MALEYLDCCAALAHLWWTRHGAGAAADLAAHRLASLVEHARAHSPFYRELYRGLPAQVRRPWELPPVDRARLMARFDDWATDRKVARGSLERHFAAHRAGELYLGRYHAWKSSGTMGVEGMFVHDAHAVAVYDALVAAQFQALPWTAARVARMAAGGGRSALIAATEGSFAAITSWEHLRRAYPGLDARAFPVTESIRNLAAALERYRPAILAGYPSVLALLAAERAAGRLAIEPALAWCGGEALAPAARAAIESAFACPLINEYGASECLSIGYECGHGAIHVNAEWVLLEGVDARGEPVPPGVMSHTTLLTNLANWLQPVIRYDLGDRITRLAGPCACASALPAFRLQGRCDDVVRLRAADGAAVPLPPLALATVVEESSGVHRFQLVQDAPDRLGLRIGPETRRGRSEAWRRVAPALRAYLARQGLENVAVTLLPGAPRIDAASGKLRAVIGPEEPSRARIRKGRRPRPSRNSTSG